MMGVTLPPCLPYFLPPKALEFSAGSKEQDGLVLYGGAIEQSAPGGGSEAKRDPYFKQNSWS